MTPEEIDTFESLRIFLAAIPEVMCQGCIGDNRYLEPELIGIDQSQGSLQGVAYKCVCGWRREIPVSMMITA